MLVDAKEDEWVLQLKRLIKAEKLNELKDVDPDQLRLYVAKRAGKWLTEKDIQGGVTDVAGLTELSGIHTPLAHFGFTEESVVNSAEDGPVHVLVKSPPPLGWLVSGSVQNALHTKGVRFRLYRLAASYLGHYDPDHVVDEHVQAFWYEDTTLRVHVLFKEGLCTFCTSDWTPDRFIFFSLFFFIRERCTDIRNWTCQRDDQLGIGTQWKRRDDCCDESSSQFDESTAH